MNGASASSAQSTRVTPASSPEGGHLGRRTDRDGDADLVQRGLGHQPGRARGGLGGGEVAAGLDHHADRRGGADVGEVVDQGRHQRWSDR